MATARWHAPHDLVGDRWTLLIVRELLIQGPCRFSDLRRGLPGIASNLLADRLREMESAALITRHNEPPPIAATLISLTERGLVNERHARPTATPTPRSPLHNRYSSHSSRDR